MYMHAVPAYGVVGEPSTNLIWQSKRESVGRQNLSKLNQKQFEKCKMYMYLHRSIEVSHSLWNLRYLDMYILPTTVMNDSSGGIAHRYRSHR